MFILQIQLLHTINFASAFRRSSRACYLCLCLCSCSRSCVCESERAKYSGLYSILYLPPLGSLFFSLSCFSAVSSFVVEFILWFVRLFFYLDHFCSCALSCIFVCVCFYSNLIEFRVLFMLPRETISIRYSSRSPCI